MKRQGVDTVVRAAGVVREINEALDKIADYNSRSPVFSSYDNIHNDVIVALCMEYREGQISSKSFLDELIKELIKSSDIKEYFKE